MTIREQLDKWADELTRHGVECSFVESELIYCHISGKRRGEIFFEQIRECPGELTAAGDAIVARRANREPLQYICGVAPFMDIELKVTPAVLIPRPETELLVEFLLREIPPGGKLLDVGTGSGAIALASAYGRGDIGVTALDVSAEALAVAEENCRLLARQKSGAPSQTLAERVEFRHSDLLSSLRGDEKFSFIAANLPYVTEEEYSTLEPEVRDHEPKLALTAAAAGAALMERLLDDAPAHLLPGGGIILEMGIAHGAPLRRHMEHAGCWENIQVRRDYNNFDRFIVAWLKK